MFGRSDPISNLETIKYRLCEIVSQIEHDNQKCTRSLEHLNQIPSLVLSTAPTSKEWTKLEEIKKFASLLVEIKKAGSLKQIELKTASLEQQATDIELETARLKGEVNSLQEIASQMRKALQTYQDNIRLIQENSSKFSALSK